MKKKELKALSKKEMHEKILELKKELVKLNIQISTGTALKNPGQVKKMKKTIARMLTEIRNRKEEVKK
ncbi:MAG TPA: 50S ribosomal protein L29 [Candidatus Nanoarchaeia archaeon]|nr:50S ribosomal protein L29 [Candidatus Nanoarchaeia archaeon]